MKVFPLSVPFHKFLCEKVRENNLYNKKEAAILNSHFLCPTIGNYF